MTSRRDFVKFASASMLFPMGLLNNISLLKSGAIVKVLGVMQDAGLPQLGDNCERCQRALDDPNEKRYVTSLGLVTPDNKTYLFDATPDIKEQIALLNKGVNRSNTNKRMPVDGIFPTHGHMGHYTGLMQIGFESTHADKIPLYCTKKMEDYLTNNGPWSQLVSKGNIVFENMDNKKADLGNGITVEAFQVPHRQEYTDAVGFIIRTQTSSLLYLPDIDSWKEWGSKTEETIGSVDIAIIDGAFYSGAELPGRDMSKVKHPPIIRSIERFRPNSSLKNTKIYFTHFNHTNPVLNKDNKIRNAIKDAGFYYVEQGMEFKI